jgi:diguanylate cyclase (GGDEF)-like protein
LPETSNESAFKVAKSIKESIANMKIVFKHETIRITISIGVETTIIAEDNFSADKLINNADMALYKAKNTGRNQISSGEAEYV